jgi:phage replication O-like protein O
MSQPENNPDPRALAESYFDVACLTRKELWRFDLNKLHLRVVSVILELSFGHGRESVKIDRLRVFCDLTGLDRGNVSRALDELQRMRIVCARKLAQQELMEYQVDPVSDHWRCRPLLTVNKLAETCEWVQMLNAPASDPTTAPAPESPPDLPTDWNA